MKKYILLIAIIFTCSISKAQNIPQYSLYVTNNYLINPAVAGIEDYSNIKIGHRNQWSGFEGAPQTSYITFHMPITNGGKENNHRASPKSKSGADRFNSVETYSGQSHHGIGGQILMDKIGPFRKVQADLTYAYHIALDDEINISAGASAGFFKNSISDNEIVFDDPESLLSASNNGIHLSIGLWLYASQFYAGVSTQQLFSKDFDLNPEVKSLSERQYLFTAGYKFSISEQFTLIPSALYKITPNVPKTLDANLMAEYNKFIWAGFTYRHQDAYSFLFGIAPNNTFDVQYAYDYTTSDIKSYSSGSHEITLGIKLGKTIKSARFRGY